MVEDSTYHAKWEGMWGSENGVPIGEAFDAAHSAPSLVKVLDVLETEGKTAVVPGCGRGWDLLQFTKHKVSQVTGLEIAPSAVAVANSFLSESGADTSIAKCIEGDWLSDETIIDPCDIGYDYTFFCALHPDMRVAWAKSWASYIVPGGHLIVLMFPIEEVGRTGPPWPVSYEAYAEVLEPAGFEIVSSELVSEADSTTPARSGKERMSVWKRK